MISNRLLIYAGSLAALVALCAYIWFQGVEHGRNELLAEQSAAQAEKQAEQDKKDSTLRDKDIAADKELTVDLSDIRDDFTALETEVPNEPITQSELPPESPDTRRANCNFGDDWIRVLQHGARGGKGGKTPATDPGDGKVSREPAGGTR